MYRACKGTFCVRRENDIAMCYMIPVRQGCVDRGHRSCQKAMQALKAQLQEDNASMAAVSNQRGFQSKGGGWSHEDPLEMGWKGDR